MATAIRYECEQCTGAVITREAWAAWSVAEQRWILFETFDHFFCHECRQEVRLVARPARSSGGA